MTEDDNYVGGRVGGDVVEEGVENGIWEGRTWIDGGGGCGGSGEKR